MEALDAESTSRSQKTVVDEEERTPCKSSELSAQKTESVTKSNERNVLGKQCAVVEKSQLVVAEVSPVDSEFDQTSSTTTPLTRHGAVTSVPVAMTSAHVGVSSELSCVTAVSAVESVPTNSPVQASIQDAFEKRKRNKRSRRRKSSGGRVQAQAAGEPLPTSEALIETEKLGAQVNPVDEMGISESVVSPSDSGGSSPRDNIATSLDSGSRVDISDGVHAPCATETNEIDAPSVSGRDCGNDVESERALREANAPAENSKFPENIVSNIPKPAENKQNSQPQLSSPPRDELQSQVESNNSGSLTPVISENTEEAGRCKDSGGREKIAVQRILEFTEDGEIEVAELADDPDFRCEIAKDSSVESSDVRKGPTNEKCSRTNIATADRSSEIEYQAYDDETLQEPQNQGDLSPEDEKLIEKSTGGSQDLHPGTGSKSQNLPLITSAHCPEKTSPSVDRSSVEIGVSMTPSGLREDETRKVQCVKQNPHRVASSEVECDAAGASSRFLSEVASRAVRESIKTNLSASPSVGVPEAAESCGLFVPLDGGVSQHPEQTHKTRHRPSRSPDYRSEAYRKLQEHRKLQNQLPVSQRPSKKLREECSMSSPVPGDAYDMDSLNTTVDSISPDSSFAQDLTYDIVDDVPRKPQKLFTFGLESAENALKPQTVSRVRKPSEESPSLASEEESDPQGYPGSAALQLSVNISNGSNDSLAPCSMIVEDLVRSQDSSTDLLSFSYVPGSHKIFVPSENVSQRQQALRVVVSSRVEPFDEPADCHSSYVRSPRLETWGRKPAAIVSPMRTPALSKAVQTQSLPNFDSDEPPSRVVQGLRSALATYEQVVCVLKRKLDDFSKNNTTSADALAKELVAEKSNNQKLEHTVNTLEKAVQSTMLRMGEVRSANSELREVVQSQLDSLTQYKSQIEDLHFEKDQLKTSHENYAAQCEERIRREKHSFEKQAALMRAQMEMKNMEVDRLQHEAKIMRDQLAACQKVINDLQQY